jgi:methyl-accepting chemotaxis protein
VGVQSYIIEGYTRQNGRIVGIGHAWNAVRIDGRFYNVDATWASGFLRENTYINQFRDSYFMIPPVDFIKTHMPFDPVWQFLNHPIDHKEFDTGDFSSLNKGSGFNFSDSIKVLSGLSTLDQLTRSNQRIIKAGLTNVLVQNEVTRNQLEISTEKYNKATDSFNRGVEKFNYYVQCKNKQFNNLSMKDDELLDLLSSSRQLVETAEMTLMSIKQVNNNIKQMAENLEKSIQNVKGNIDQEDNFISKYINTPKSNRKSLFYKKNG